MQKHKIHIQALLIILSWIFLFKKTIAWIFNTYFLYDNIFGMVVLFGIFAIIIMKAKQSKLKLNNLVRFEFKKFPFAIVLLSVTAYLLSEYYIGLNIVSSVIFGFGTYGMIGLFLPYKKWLQAFVPAILIIQTLPFGTNLDTYLGFPLRMFTTDIVTNILSGTGIENLQSETVIFVENRAANIDLSCSGMKGIWSGIIFFFIVLWLEKRKINLYTISLFVLLIFLQIGFNIARITAIVLIDTVYNLPKIAEIIHLPTGIIGFVFSLLIIWLLLKLKNKKTQTFEHTDFTRTDNSKPKNKLTSNITRYSLIFVIISASFFHLEKEIVSIKKEHHQISLPANFHTKEIALTKDEQILLISEENDFAKKIRFSNDTISGSVLISTTSNWRGHHKPELCFESGGLKVKKANTKLIENNFRVRELIFRKKQSQIAYYWFQSKEKTTADYSARVWNAVLGKYTEWTMVSVLFDKQYNEEEIKDFLNKLRQENINK